MSEVITNEGNLLSGEGGGMTPVTRKELFLAKLAGMDVQTPTPITREEMFLQMAIEAGGGSGGGASSWNDLTDKPFYEEDNREVFFPEENVPFALNSSVGLYFAADGKPESLVIGEIYTVIWDEKEYVCTAVDTSSLNGGAEMIAIGNGTAFGMSGNNEPFIIATTETSILLYVVDPTDTSEYHTAGIFKGAVTIKTLDAKFLPKPATSIDLSGFESDGKIVETFADGSPSTTVMEFDANGKPTKITDGNGNVTVLTW